MEDGESKKLYYINEKRMDNAFMRICVQEGHITRSEPKGSAVTKKEDTPSPNLSNKDKAATQANESRTIVGTFEEYIEQDGGGQLNINVDGKTYEIYFNKDNPLFSKVQDFAYNDGTANEMGDAVSTITFVVKGTEIISFSYETKEQ